MMVRLRSLLVGGTCINSVFSQSLQQAIASRSDLSGFADLISPYLSALSSYTNITVLAPNNAAVSAFLNSSAAANLEDSFPALLVRCIRFIRRSLAFLKRFIRLILCCSYIMSCKAIILAFRNQLSYHPIYSLENSPM